MKFQSSLWWFCRAWEINSVYVDCCCCVLQSAQRTVWRALCRAEGHGATRMDAMPLLPTTLTTEAVSVCACRLCSLVWTFRCNVRTRTMLLTLARQSSSRSRISYRPKGGGAAACDWEGNCGGDRHQLRSHRCFPVFSSFQFFCISVIVISSFFIFIFLSEASYLSHNHLFLDLFIFCFSFLFRLKHF